VIRKRDGCSDLQQDENWQNIGKRWTFGLPKLKNLCSTFYGLVMIQEAT
jgi:hypothetical protein